MNKEEGNDYLEVCSLFARSLMFVCFVFGAPPKYNAGNRFHRRIPKKGVAMLPVAGTNLALSHYLVIVGMALVVLGVAFYWLPVTRVKMAALALAILGGLTAGAALLLVASGGAGLSRKPLRVDFSKRSLGAFPDDPSEMPFFRRPAEEARKYPANYDPLAARKKALEETSDDLSKSPLPVASLLDQLQKADAAGRLGDPDLKKAQRGDIVRTGVLRVPTQAVLSDGTQRFCFVKLEKKIELRQLEIGLSDGSYVEVIRGLQEGESVIANPRNLAPRLGEGVENKREQ